MTLPEAKKLFATLMARSRVRLLTDPELDKLRTASQVIRYAKRKTAANARGTRTVIRKRTGRSRVSRKRGTNPGNRVLIYESITRIEGTKGAKSLYPRQKFFHNFKKPYPRMYGLPDGSLLISSK